MNWNRGVPLAFLLAACGGGSTTTPQPDARPAAVPDATAAPDAVPQPQSCFTPPGPPAKGVSIGAIRWDAWFEEPEVPPLINHASFWGHQWFERLPFDAKLSDGKWLTASDKQSIVDQEIDYAVTRGIDYWAFVYGRFTANDYETGTYPDYADLDGYLRDNYRQGRILDMYLASSHCAKPRFALIVGAGAFNDYLNVWRPGVTDVSRDVAWQILLRDFRPLLGRPEQHTTLDGRPILFMIRGVDWGHAWDDNPTLARQKLDELRQVAVADGAKPAFVVDMDTPLDAEIAVRDFGFDGASSYGWNAGLSDGPGVEVPWSQADFDVDWVARTQLAEGLDVIPTVVRGWDYRPEVPFDSLRDPRGNWFEHVGPAPFVNQLDHAIQFVKANPTKAAARSVIVYAWNELAEGGYIMPTLAAGSATLDAIAAYLGKPIPPATPSLAPVVMPAVSKRGTGCSDGYGIWLIGTNFDADSYIQLRAATLGQEAVLATYREPTRAPAEGQQSLAICLAGAAERAAFAAQGVRVSVVNPSRPSTHTPVLVRLGD